MEINEHVQYFLLKKIFIFSIHRNRKCMWEVHKEELYGQFMTCLPIRFFLNQFCGKLTVWGITRLCDPQFSSIRQMFITKSFPCKIKLCKWRKSTLRLAWRLAIQKICGLYILWILLLLLFFFTTCKCCLYWEPLCVESQTFLGNLRNAESCIQ